ncbi:DUF3150 domain-containing protein [Desulfovibrio sp. Fe33]|uniref:DUF3150 domain-containing protein n=1 Tax=Desulfovibrio sp. Fe33 TaxID=3020842 RepID=UPI00234D899E|nr:DUF3150 domain-containing protein [Desulfovibrio sp. Fe33]
MRLDIVPHLRSGPCCTNSHNAYSPIKRRKHHEGYQYHRLRQPHGPESERKHLDCPQEADARRLQCAKLPPEELASLGSKKICDPKELRIFGTLKARAVNLLDRTGVRFLGGWGIPEDMADDIVIELNAIRDDFLAAKEQSLSRHDEAVRGWISQHPGGKSLIGSSQVSADYVRSRLDFRWQFFKLVPPTDNVVGHGLQNEVSELGDTLFDEVAKAAADTWKRCFEGKDKVTHKALSPLRSIHSKLAGLSFVEPREMSVVDRLDTAFNRMPKLGHTEGVPPHF